MSASAELMNAEGRVWTARTATIKPYRDQSAVEVHHQLSSKQEHGVDGCHGPFSHEQLASGRHLCVYKCCVCMCVLLACMQIIRFATETTLTCVYTIHELSNLPTEKLTEVGCMKVRPRVRSKNLMDAGDASASTVPPSVCENELCM